MKSRWFVLLLVFSLLAGCIGAPGNTPGDMPAAPELPPPSIGVTKVPDYESELRGFFSAWKADAYDVMYGYLTETSQQTIEKDKFIQRYQVTMNALGLQSLDYSIVSTTVRPEAAQVVIRTTYNTSMLGNIVRDATYDMKLENGKWRINWEDGLILSELRGGNYLSMDYEKPSRGDIYDRNGNAIVSQADVVSLGLIPGNINFDQEGTLLYELSRLVGIPTGTIQERYTYAGGDWYVPVGEASLKEVNQRYGVLVGLSGLVMNNYTSRYYWQSGIAPQTVGYTSALQPEQLNEYVRKGYAPDARIGQMGVEKWAENYLAGKTGGTLYVISPQGNVVSYLAKTDPQPASSLTLTIDKDLQFQSQQAMEGFRGAIVVLERDTGRVLAMVSSPEFDPNLFDPNNNNSASGLGILVNDTNTPLVNRATQGQYPLGSVFKVITMVAGLESGTYTKDSTWDCQYEYRELPDRVLYDWTWDHFQAEFRATGEGKTQPSGLLTLPEGLMRSCNPWFWHLGYDLFRQGRVTAIADMARGFGLGSITGLGQVAEQPGQINNPPTILDAVNQAIGQGDLLVTPLQVANFMAAIGNGGTLYRPQVVEKITASDGTETQLFSVESIGTLPVKPENLQILRDAMRSVVANPRGTAAHRFREFEIPIYAKTGTAESSIPGYPHSWFAGYTEASTNTGLPDIAIAVIAENEGEGSEYAAQIFRRVVEIYYFGKPRRLYSWESNFGVTRTPTLPVTPTINGVIGNP